MARMTSLATSIFVRSGPGSLSGGYGLFSLLSVAVKIGCLYGVANHDTIKMLKYKDDTTNIVRNPSFLA